MPWDMSGSHPPPSRPPPPTVYLLYSFTASPTYIQCTVSMETAEEVTVAGPPRVTPSLAGYRRRDCGLPGASARVDSSLRSPPPLHSARGSGRMTLPGPNREGRTWLPVR
ncbi:unnamed protein product [Rangifer tarandus platyrhynchus]|uniref:Uncharacterized protein n=1 Tax=Rangifer tarandus platyrhynchus TaxID=3082113 RepID=A0ABN8Z9R2_RANTA|nr:unnamed protein product [Rangifer tarandus platyrhynchus]CAI9688913.1 unnamed protein product [Rangifer tarandus platyrhynchus]